MMMIPRGVPGHSKIKPMPPWPGEDRSVESSVKTITDRFDKDKNGSIDVASESVSFADYSPYTGGSVSQMQELARVADLSGNADGQVTSDELTKVLNYYDTDKNGKLNHTELKQFNDDLGPTKTTIPGINDRYGSSYTSPILGSLYGIALRQSGVPGSLLRGVADAGKQLG